MHDRLKRTARKRGNYLRAQPIIRAHQIRATEQNHGIRVFQAWQNEHNAKRTTLSYSAWYDEQAAMAAVQGAPYPPADDGRPAPVYRRVGPIGYLRGLRSGPGS